MKPIPKHLRESNRYVAFTVVAHEPCSYDQVREALELSIVALVGTLGAGKANIQVVKDKFQWPKGVVKTNSASVEAVRAAIALTSAIGNKPCAIQTTITSGQIHNC